MTPAELALVLLIANGVAMVWDLIDPSALRLTWRTGSRALFSFLLWAGTLWLLLLVVGATAAASVAVVAAVLIAALLRLIHGSP